MNSSSSVDTKDSFKPKVTYDSENHFSVLTQMHGSVWPKVLPHCILNLLNVYTIYYVDKFYNINVSYSDRGHSFISMIVSFLIVTRSNITYSRFMESREYLSVCMRSCRELMQYSVTMTRYDTSEKAKKWRQSMARRTIVVLRAVVKALQFPSTKEHTWKSPILTNRERTAVIEAVGEFDHVRTPMILTMFLRNSIASHSEYLQEPLHVAKELRLYAFVSDFVGGYHGLIKLIDTQFPFPLCQMNRTFVFFWVYSLPWVLYNDNIQLASLMLIVFFITYAFIGLEYVSIELDDPYGNDPNDFDILGLANVVFQDIQLCLYDVDGKDASDKLDSYFEFGAISANNSVGALSLTGSMSVHSYGSGTLQSSGVRSKPGHFRRQSSDCGDRSSMMMQKAKRTLGEEDFPNTYGSTSFNSPTLFDQRSTMINNFKNSRGVETSLGTDDLQPMREDQQEFHPLLSP